MPQNGLHPRMPRMLGRGHRRFVSGAAYMNAIQTDGVNDYVRVPALAGTATPNQLSMCCWLHYDGVAVGTPRLWQSATTPSANTFFLQLEGSVQYLYYGSIAVPQAVATVVAGQWYHLALVADKLANTMRVFWNAQQVLNYTPPAHPSSFADFLLMGTGAGYCVQGRLDEVIYLSRALSAAEVALIYNTATGPGPFVQTGLELYLPMNEINAGTTPDVSGQGRHASLFNGATLVPRP